jgi:hypothetical protein
MARSAKVAAGALAAADKLCPAHGVGQGHDCGAGLTALVLGPHDQARDSRTYRPVVGARGR